MDFIKFVKDVDAYWIYRFKRRIKESRDQIMSLLEYKGYQGTIETEDNILFGHVLGLKNTIISYEGNTINELKTDFQNGIDDYLENC